MKTPAIIRDISIKLGLALALVAIPVVGISVVAFDSAPVTIAGFGTPDEVDAG